MEELVRLRMRPSRDKKTFRYMLDYVDEQGKRRQVSLGHADKRKAERQRKEKELELRMGIVGPEVMKLSQFLEDSLTRTRGQIRPSTLRQADGAMRDFIRYVGDVDLRQVKHQHGERFVRECLDNGNSPATVAKKVRHVKRLFQLAVDRGQLVEHPLRSLRQPKSPRKKVRVYTDEECDRLFKAAQEYEQVSRPYVPWKLLIQMAHHTGMRRGELLNTTWRDIDFAKRTVDVSPKNNTKHTWEWHIKDTDRRTLPLTTETLKMLAMHQAMQPEGHPYVFIPSWRYDRIQQRRKSGCWTIEDGRCPLNNFTDRFNRIKAMAGIERGEFHDLRRTCLSTLLANGLSEYEVMVLAGHATFETTRQFYLAVRPDIVDRARAVYEGVKAADSVARLWRAPLPSDIDKRLQNTTALKPTT